MRTGFLLTSRLKWVTMGRHKKGHALKRDSLYCNGWYINKVEYNKWVIVSWLLLHKQWKQGPCQRLTRMQSWDDLSIYMQRYVNKHKLQHTSVLGELFRELITKLEPRCKCFELQVCLFCFFQICSALICGERTALLHRLLTNGTKYFSSWRNFMSCFLKRKNKD